MKEPVYRVLWPLGRSVSQSVSLKPRLSDLKGKTICELSDMAFRSEEIFPMIRETMQERYAGINFIDNSVFGNIHGPKETEVIKDLPALLKKHGCDAVITGIGS